MFRHNLLIALRHLFKNKVNTMVNVFGLAISLSAFILLGNFVYRELTTDRFHEHADRIFAVSLTEGNSLSTPAVLSQYLNESIPEIEKTTRCQLFIRNYVSVQNADQAPLQSKIIFADSSFFDIFFADFFNSVTIISTPLSNPLFKAIGLAPADTFLNPALAMA